MSLAYKILRIPKTIDEFINKISKREYKKVNIEVKDFGFPDYYKEMVFHAANLDMSIKREIKESGLIFLTLAAQYVREKQALQDSLEIAGKFKERFNDSKSDTWINYKDLEEIGARINELDIIIEKEKKGYPSLLN